jgi:hypothetical protein
MNRIQFGIILSFWPEIISISKPKGIESFSLAVGGGEEMMKVE